MSLDQGDRAGAPGRLGHIAGDTVGCASGVAQTVAKPRDARGVTRDDQHVSTELTQLVDDGSADDTARIAEAAGARVLRQTRNRGYGAALQRGIRAAATDYVMTLDADGQHRVEDALRLWARIGHDDMVVGERTRLVHSPLWRMPGKWVLGWTARRLVGRPIPDLNCGLRVMRTEVARRYLHICPDGFSFSTTMPSFWVAPRAASSARALDIATIRRPNVRRVRPFAAFHSSSSRMIAEL